MSRWVALAAVIWMCVARAQTGGTPPAPRPGFETFEVATVKPAREDEQGRYIKMEGADRFIGQNYTLKLLIAVAYDLNPKTISGGPGWVDSRHFDVAARTPGQVLPTHDEQMKMLRSLLTERFQLTFHREKKDFAIYALGLARGGAKLTPSATPGEPPLVGPGVVYPGRIVLPGRNATAGELASILQRAMLDRPVVDRTSLTGRYDFTLEWAPNESELGGDVAAAPEGTAVLPLFEAIQQQLGLRLEATHGAVDALVIDSAQKPVEN